MQTEYLAVLITIAVLLLAYYTRVKPADLSHHYNIPDPECTGVFNLCTDQDKERLGRQAIQHLHQQIDDDKDGFIEHTESSDFIQQKLDTPSDSKRHRQFQSSSSEITRDDLWNQWTKNPVYNWTSDRVLAWLVTDVQLPQYVDHFRRNQFDGRMIPRLAANERHYISTIMQVRDLRDKELLILKSTDLILLGSTEQRPTHRKYYILIALLVVSVLGCFYAFCRQRQIQGNMNVMLKEFQVLQQAENAFTRTKSKKIHREANRLRRYRDATIAHDRQMSSSRQEIEQLKSAIHQSEEHAWEQTKEPPTELIELL